MSRIRRKTATKVRDGRVTRKNRTALTHHYCQTRQAEPVFDRCRPPRGFRHYLTLADVRRFVGILPDWPELSVGLDAVVLAGDGSIDGWYDDGIVAVCPWERDPAVRRDPDFVAAHAPVLDRLDVPREATADGSGEILCRFDAASVRGFQLMHVLLHELGHHRDRMTTRSKDDCARGEAFAEDWANRRAEELWEDYFRTCHR